MNYLKNARRSELLLAVVLALIGLAASSQMPGASRLPGHHSVGPLEVAHPRDYVLILQGSALVVPPGKSLVVTGLGAWGGPQQSMELRIDGVRAFTASVNYHSCIAVVPPHYRIQAGAVVEPTNGSPTGPGIALGVLVDQAHPTLPEFGSIPVNKVVRIDGSGPYVVPNGKTLAITGLGGDNDNPGQVLKINGIQVASTTNQPFENTTSIHPIPPGISAQSGDVVEVSLNTGVALGFLVDN